VTETRQGGVERRAWRRRGLGVGRAELRPGCARLVVANRREGTDEVTRGLPARGGTNWRDGKVTRDTVERHEVRQGACRRVVRREVHGRSARLPGLGARLRSLRSLPSPRGPPRSRRGVRTPERAGLDAWRRERQRARDARA
jgi:hypothetical protein